ncbi:hypothetical protein BHE74_00009350 [Ensete ventricosum]|uniref:LIM zinc-binding domain-containing protein n=1 Tax=Ensete ventricosum TaxID=4639 RepID=A0A426YKC9_ENSVE|nr:hypothetical protein B296_00050668 [Ensete ventricosum]RWW82203.1 hypothetical protein BHE74_00009350 [Ensete ventricosum]
MSFSGTQDKCKACDKTVHFIDLLTADGVPYHKTCFKCSHCKGTLSMCNYSSMDGILYCKPHFEQLFKETGSFSKKFPTSNSHYLFTISRISKCIFLQLKEINSICKLDEDSNGCCSLPWQLTVEGESYHKTCFKCSHGGCTLTPSSYAALDGILYCKHHFAQLFKEKGSYNHLNKVASMKRSSGAEEAPSEEAAAEPTPDEEQS